MSDSNGVLVFSENYDLILEILGKGREIADELQAKLAVLTFEDYSSTKPRDLIRYGADKVYNVETPRADHFQVERCLSALHGLATSYRPSIILIGSTRTGKPLAARLASRLDAGCVPDCIGMSINGQGRLIGERITYGGNAVARITFRGRPQIATVPARAFEKPEPKERTGQVVKLDSKAETSRTEIMDSKPLETSTMRIEEAEVIVSCGRGLEKKEDKALLEDFAKAACGQVGCSRPLAEDRKWFSEWVGLSGHKVKPKLYVACGISGVIQHVAGIRDAKVIVAINEDPEAPIFEVADYGIVGNLYEILPAIKEALVKQTNR